MKRAWLFIGAAVVSAGAVLAWRRRQAWRARALAQDLRGLRLADVLERMPPPHAVTMTPLVDNGDAWAARWRILQRARRSIDVATFILSADAFGLAFLGALLRKAHEGVAVRVLLDANGVTRSAHPPLPEAVLATLREAGVAVRLYNVPSLRHLGIVLRRRSVLPVLACEHDKIVLVDSNAAIVGGRNLSAEYFAAEGDREDAFTDRDLLLEGPGIASQMRRALDHEHAAPATEVPRADGPTQDARALLLGAAAMMDRWLVAKPLPPSTLDALIDSAGARVELVEHTRAELLACCPEPLASEDLEALAASFAAHPRLRGILGRDPPASVPAEARAIDASSALGDTIDRINHALLALLAAARSHVVVETPYLVLSERALIALEAAARRGVRVTIVTNGPTSSDNAMAQGYFMATWPKLLARVPTLRLFVHRGARNAHGKTAVVDGKLALVGSYNLDFISAAVNSELMVVLRGAEAVRTVEAPIDEALASVPSSLIEYRIDRAALAEGRVVPVQGPSDHAPLRERLEATAWSRVISLLGFTPSLARP